MKVDNVELVLSQICQIILEAGKDDCVVCAGSLIWRILQFINLTTAVREVHTDLGLPDLKELGDIDEEGSKDGREEVGDDPGGASLHLSIVMRSAHGLVSFNCHGEDQEDTQTQNYPETVHNQYQNRFGKYSEIYFSQSGAYAGS